MKSIKIQFQNTNSLFKISQNVWQIFPYFSQYFGEIFWYSPLNGQINNIYFSFLKCRYWIFTVILLHGRRQDFFRRGNTFKKIFKKIYEIFRKLLKIFLWKLLKMHYFSIFFKKFNKPCVKFLRVWTKNEICRKFSKVFLRTLRKSIILADFSQI